MARPSRRQAAATEVQQAAPIDAFLKVSKTRLATKELAAKNEIGLLNTIKPAVDITAPAANILPPLNSRKRRAADDLDEESVQISMVLSMRTKARLPKRSCRSEDHAVVAEKENIPAQTKPKAPTVSEAQKLHYKSTAKSVIAKAKARTTSRPKKSVHELLVEKHATNAQKMAARTTNSASQQLPAEFADLIELHRALLKAIVLKHAHGGSKVPLPLAELLPHVAQAWGRRAVTVEDVRRCVAVEDLARERRRESQGQGQGQEGQDASGSGSPFVICDYGRGRVCLEVADEHAGAPINEKRLCREFERSLVWLRAQRDAGRATDCGTSTTDTDAKMELDIPLEALSLADLPQAPIAARASLFPTNPLLARGQRALAELKNGIAERRLLEKASAAAVAVKSKSADDAMAVDNGPTANEATTVLDRIRAKQQARAAGPPPPSAAELERRAALQRAVDVAAVVRAYTRATGRGLPRVAVPMPTLLQRLRDSLRVPLSGDEGVAVVRLLAREVAPEWLKIVVVGGRETVVVQTGAEPSERLVAERAERFA